MKKFVFILTGSLLMAVICSVAVRADNSIKEGKWEITSKMDMQAVNGGIPAHYAASYQQGQGGTMSFDGTTAKISPEQVQIGQDVTKLEVRSNGRGVGGQMTMNECVTNSDPIASIKKMAEMFHGCEEPKIKKDGSTVDYSMACKNQMSTMEMIGHFVYNGESMVGYAHLHSKMSGRESNMKIDYTGRYVGPC